MESIVDRVRMIVRSEVGELQERFKDPEHVINQTIADVQVSYAKMRQDARQAFEAEAQLKERLETLSSEAARWHKVAVKALAAGNEDDARTALSREQDLKERIGVQQELCDQASEVADKLRARLTEVEDAISQMQAQAARIRAKGAATQAAKVSAQLPGDTGAFDRYEQQADWSRAEAEGYAEARHLVEDPFSALEAD